MQASTQTLTAANDNPGGTIRIERAPTGLVSLLGRAAARRFVEAAQPANINAAPAERSIK
ncbi:hypothetical protein [Thioclava pacifica]|uniref:Uncharacterized protein n=1 Tax=Thioclava pacifica DSM 10166 TaxID=1353537 RepID=A0A074JXS1_9RHOB|nr:hypothetical protein [Thioclava pacifica]KEO54117.1 hypothetical protein TP2_04145 [Thioclava pacifica DSM 10166]